MSDTDRTHYRPNIRKATALAIKNPPICKATLMEIRNNYHKKIRAEADDLRLQAASALEEAKKIDNEIEGLKQLAEVTRLRVARLHLEAMELDASVEEPSDGEGDGKVVCNGD
jgi:hypothetical protein